MLLCLACVVLGLVAAGSDHVVLLLAVWTGSLLRGVVLNVMVDLVDGAVLGKSRWYALRADLLVLSDV